MGKLDSQQTIQSEITIFWKGVDARPTGSTHY